MDELTRRQFLGVGLSTIVAGGLAGWSFERALAEPFEKLVENLPETTLGKTGWKTKVIGLGCIFRPTGKWPMEDSDRVLDLMKSNGELAAIYKAWRIWNDRQKELGVRER